ncbi:MAG TPA: hypothetical protein DEO85_05185 [Maritimibacter sp.]|nr:hypothetical protein [Maritimibacter sp.]
MKRLVLVAALALASPAQALTIFPDCTEMDETIEAAMNKAMSYHLTYVLAVGAFRGAKVLSEQRGYDVGHYRRVTTTFSGKSASNRGFTNAIKVPVELEQACLNTACTPRTDGTPYLVLMLKDEQGYMVQLGEFGCTAPFFERPSATMQRKAIQCLNAGAC